MKNILITGGNGFVGSHLSDALSVRGHTITLVDLTFDLHTADSKARKVVCDVLDYENLRDASKDAEITVHLAGISRVEDGEKAPEECRRVNLGGTRNVVRIASEERKGLVFASSREVYGNADALPVDEDSPKQPVSVYAQSKLSSEELLAEAGRTGRFPYMIARLSNVYGSTRDRPERVVPTFVRQALSGEGLTIQGGSQTADFTFIDDVAEALARFAESVRMISGESYNIVTGHSYSIVELAEMVKRLTRTRSQFEFQDGKDYYAKEFSADPTKVRAYLGGKVRLRGLEEGLELYLQRVNESRPEGP
jgi:nucleoside-diphosphate-sugar epimerase